MEVQDDETLTKALTAIQNESSKSGKREAKVG